MKPTITNPTIRKTAAWISKHRYGFYKLSFFLLLVLSLIWLEGKRTPQPRRTQCVDQN